jgi:hypothetical protein
LLKLGSHPRARAIDFHVPGRLGDAELRVNGAPVAASIDENAVRVNLSRQRLRTVSLAVDAGARRGSVVVILRGGDGGKLAIPLS